MYYADTSKLPTTIRETLPDELQKIYLDAYNAAWETQPGAGHHGLTRESLAHQIAWDAMNRDYVLDAKRGKWYPKGEVPVEEDAEKESWWQKLRKVF